MIGKYPVRAFSFAEILEPRRLMAGASMIRDINQTTDNLDPEHFAVAGSVAYFAGRAAEADGAELWKTNGTPGGTVLVKDINIGLTGSDPSNLTIMNGLVYFAATDAKGGKELWKSDGSAAGTVRVHDINSGTTSSSPANLTVVGNTLYFTADSGSGARLWKTDGSDAGTVQVTPDLATPQSLVAYNGVLLFTAVDSTHGREVWRSDGTLNGTTLVKDIISGSTSSNPTALIVFGGAVYFQADPSSTSHGDLYRTDGTDLGTVRVKQINVTSADSTKLVNLTISGNLLFFIAADSSNGVYQLWRSDGSDTGTFAISAGSGLSTFTSFGPFGAHSVVFTGYSAAAGYEPWTSDGTTATLLKDTVPGSESGVSSSAGYLPVGTTLYFAPNRAYGYPELWKTDGTTSGTVFIKSIDPAEGYVLPQTVLGNGFLFSTLRYISEGDLYYSNGTAAGTTRVGSSSAGTGYSMSDYPTTNYNSRAFFVDGSTAYFSANDGLTGRELWKAAPGDPNGAVKVADLAPGGTSSDPAGFVRTTDGSIYFSALPSVTGMRMLYRMPAGGGTPQLLMDSRGQFVPTSPNVLSPVGNMIFFRGTAADGKTYLWRYNPVARTFDQQSGNGQLLTSILNPFVQAGNFWYFAANTSATGTEFWKTDGNSISLVRDIVTGASSSSPANLTAIGSNIFFTANSAAGTELWKSDGSSTGTQQVVDLTAGSGSTTFGELYAFGNVLYFDGAGALMRSDGTVDGTYKVADLSSAKQFVSPGDGRFYFIGTDAAGTIGVYRSDGTGDGTIAVLDSSPSGAKFEPVSLYAAGGRIYIVGYGGANRERFELWRTDGTPGDAEWLWELAPHVAGSGALSAYWFVGRLALAASDSQLFFPAYSPQYGIEPYQLPLSGAGSTAPAVAGVTVNDTSAQRSMVSGLTITFAERVTLQTGAFQLLGRNGAGTGTGVAWSNPSNDGRTFVLTFTGSGLTGGSLADGVYDLTVIASKVHAGSASGPALAANYTFTFHRLFGDFDGNKTVNNADSFRFTRTYLAKATDATFIDCFDFTGDGTVNNSDNFQFSRRYLTSVVY